MECPADPGPLQQSNAGTGADYSRNVESVVRTEFPRKDSLRAGRFQLRVRRVLARAGLAKKSRDRRALYGLVGRVTGDAPARAARSQLSPQPGCSLPLFASPDAHPESRFEFSLLPPNARRVRHGIVEYRSERECTYDEHPWATAVPANADRHFFRPEPRSRLLQGRFFNEFFPGGRGS